MLSKYSQSSAPETWTADGVVWNLTYGWVDASNQYFTAGKTGLAFGSSKNGIKTITLNTGSIGGDVTEVTINGVKSGSGGTVSAVVSVGGNLFVAEKSETDTTAADLTFKGNAKGEIEIVLTQTVPGKQLVFTGLKVVYNKGGSDKETPRLTFAESSLSLEVGASKTAPALTASVEGLSISYKSGDEAIATCDAATGIVTAVGEGTTTITATSAETEQYNSASVSFIVTVTPKLELFSRATSVVSGHKYVFVADGKVTTGAVMVQGVPTYEVPASKPYGYLQVTDVVVTDNTIHVPEKYALTVTAVDGGYSIQNYIGAYYYQQGGIFNTISLSTEVNNQSVWNIEPQEDGTMKIVGTDNHYLQLDSSYGTYGAYVDAKGFLPVLYQLGEIEVAPAMPDFESDEHDVLIISAVGTTIYYRLSDTTSAASVKGVVDLEADGWIKNPDTANPHELMLSKDDLKGKTIEYMAISASGLQSDKGMFAVADDGVVTGIEGIEAEAAEAEVEWFNLQGVRVANPESGLYIRRQGNKVEKVIVK